MNLVCLINIPLVKNLGNIMDFISFLTKNEENITFENPTTIDQTMAKKYCIELSISFLLVKYHSARIKIRRKSFFKQVKIENVQKEVVFKKFWNYVRKILYDISKGNIPPSFSNFKKELSMIKCISVVKIAVEEINKANFHLIKNFYSVLSNLPLQSWYCKIISKIIIEMGNERELSQFTLLKMSKDFNKIDRIIKRKGTSSSLKHFAEDLLIFINKKNKEIQIFKLKANLIN